jgi:hypothetical protein
MRDPLDDLPACGSGVPIGIRAHGGSSSSVRLSSRSVLFLGLSNRCCPGLSRVTNGPICSAP